MLEDIKVEPIQPLIISKEEMGKIARKILEKKIKWVYEQEWDSDKDKVIYDDLYWLITISPEGDIILPDENTGGHPELAEYKIFPQDRLLMMLYDFYTMQYRLKYGCGVAESPFMMKYGYINIDGYYEGNDVDTSFNVFAYNENALTAVTQLLPANLRAYFCEEYSYQNDPFLSAVEENDSITIPKIKRRCLDYLEKEYNVSGRENINNFLDQNDLVKRKVKKIIKDSYYEIMEELNNECQSLESDDPEL